MNRDRWTYLHTIDGEIETYLQGYRGTNREEVGLDHVNVKKYMEHLRLALATKTVTLLHRYNQSQLHPCNYDHMKF